MTFTIGYTALLYAYVLCYSPCTLLSFTPSYALFFRDMYVVPMVYGVFHHVDMYIKLIGPKWKDCVTSILNLSKCHCDRGGRPPQGIEESVSPSVLTHASCIPSYIIDSGGMPISDSDNWVSRHVPADKSPARG